MAETFGVQPFDDEFSPRPVTTPTDEFGAPLPAQFAARPVTSSTQQLSSGDAEEILRQLGLASAPIQEARLGSAITDLLPQIQGSPAAIRDAVVPQVTAIRDNLSRVFEALSQRLGRFGGGQLKRERGRAVGAAGAELQSVFARQPAIAFQQLQQVLSGFNPFLLAQPPLQTSSAAVPADFGEIGGGLLDIVRTGQDLFGQQQPTPFSPAVVPLTPDVVPPERR